MPVLHEQNVVTGVIDGFLSVPGKIDLYRKCVVPVGSTATVWSTLVVDGLLVVNGLVVCDSPPPNYVQYLYNLTYFA